MFKIVKTDNQELSFKEFVFPAGEVSIKLSENNYRYTLSTHKTQTIVARLQNSDDFMKLAMMKDALERLDSRPINLFLPYVPYARQDRVCVKGESFSIKVFGNLLNGLNFNEITIVDPHSYSAESVINRVKVLSQLDIINKNLDFVNRAVSCILVSPDAGSNKKVAEIATYFNHENFIRADKLRDLSNGKIKETIVYADDLKGRDIVILDDLVERGGTFILLAQTLKKKNCGKIILYVTHGIFAGKEKDTVIENLYKGGIDEIWTTDSYRQDLIQTPTFNVFPIEKAFTVQE